jgi:hypothetical protein
MMNDELFFTPAFEGLGAGNQDGGQFIRLIHQVEEPFCFDNTGIRQEFNPISRFLQFLQGAFGFAYHFRN